MLDCRYRNDINLCNVNLIKVTPTNKISNSFRKFCKGK